MKKSIFLPVMAIALLTACHDKKNEAGTTETPSVDVAKVVEDSVIMYSTLPGSLAAERTVDIVGRVNGQLLSQNYTPGDLVQAGQVLYTIESTSYRDAVQQAQAALATANSTYEYASNHYEAVKKALESDAVSKMEVSQAKSAMEQAEASIANAKAALESARKQLSYCTVRAPFTGYISASKYDVGAYIGGEGAPVVMATLYDNAAMSVHFAIDDDQYLAMVGNLKAGNPELGNVPLEFADSLPHSYTGALYFVAPAISNSTGTLQLKCKVQNPYNELKPGMFVKVKLPYGIKTRAILVKDASIGSDQLGKYLYTVNDSDKVVYTPIQTGEIYRDSMRVVTSGVTPQTRYVTKALLKVRNGMKITPVTVK